MGEPDRHVSLEASFNFRDIGGYETADGSRVRWGAIYRSDSLQWLTERDAELLSDLELRTIVDLRSTSEVTRHRQSIHLDWPDYRHVPFFEFESLPFKPFEPGDPQPITGEFYLTLATACGDAIATALRLIANSEHALVFHCAQGKDRTGVLAAILLASLGVAEETIIADYALSQRSLDPTIAWARANAPEFASEIASLPSWMFQSSPEFMSEFLDRLLDRFGSVDAYLDGIGVDAEVVATLRRRLLEPIDVSDRGHD